MTKTNQSLDLTAFRSRLESATGEEYWRGLEELAEEEGFQEFLDQEFPSYGNEFASGVDRRNFLKLMGASMALAGLTACDVPPMETIVPYVENPEVVIPGRPLYYATTMSLGRSATGVLVESHMGRPTKIEGNPQHPASLGASGPFEQAATLQLYDPDRSQAVRNRGKIRTWNDFSSAMSAVLELRKGAAGGRGIRILTETVVSPTMGRQLETILQSMPQAKWHQYDAAVADNGREGRRRALGSYQDPVFRFDKADVVLSLDRDFMGSGEGYLRYARDFASRRKVRSGSANMNRLYVAEASPSPTSAIADHHFPTRASDMEAVAKELASALRGGSSSISWIAAVAKDLRTHSGSSIVIAGEHLPPAVHEAVHQINQALGNVGQTVFYQDPAEVRPVNQIDSLRDLVADMNAGEVEVLVMIGGNPVYAAPADLGFADALAKVPFRAHMSLFYDETSERCDWHLPAAHFLESWSDARSFDGTESIVQPLIEPLYDGQTAHELLAIFTGEFNATALDIVRGYWQTRATGGNFEKWWKVVLHDGFIRSEDVAPATFNFPAPVAAAPVAPEGFAPGDFEVVFRPDPGVYDGRFANNGWLQEMPKPLTKITWDNAALLSPATARALGVTTEDVIEVNYRGGKLQAPVWITPGHAPQSVTLFLGYGRPKAGRVGSDLGYNATLIRPSDSPWIATGAQVRKTTGHYELASTQRHFRMHGRDLVRAASFDTFQRDPHLSIAELTSHEPGEAVKSPSMYGDPWEYPGYAWGMSVDTSVCTGCGGCVVACVAENNIPVVGKKEVLREREMHWLRIDRYYKGNADTPQTFHQPVLCQHCENAPCEPVCPVEATSHSNEGLNDMTYNRCVGTRYCSNNCPYKVRRFNFFQYSDFNTPSLKLGRNPDVTVRSRGVMEKCTYCVQRINAARIVAQREDRQIKDGEIRTACEQACPTQAIAFGNINDPEARVTKLKHEPHDYSLLEEVNTRPRTTYLATIRNLNPEIS